MTAITRVSTGLFIGALAIAGCAANHHNNQLATSSRENVSPTAIGISKAQRDIAGGKMRILYFGKPWSVDKPLIDGQSGLPIEIVAGCDVTVDFVQETEAYNRTMREAVNREKEHR
jgi:hypothetical protein